MLLTYRIMCCWLSCSLCWWFCLCSYAVIGRSLFSVNLGIGNLGEGLERWRGYYQSIRPMSVLPLRTLSLWFPPLMHFLLPQRNVIALASCGTLLNLLSFLLIFLLCLEGGREVDNLGYLSLFSMCSIEVLGPSFCYLLRIIFCIRLCTVKCITITLFCNYCWPIIAYTVMLIVIGLIKFGCFWITRCNLFVVLLKCCTASILYVVWLLVVCCRAFHGE